MLRSNTWKHLAVSGWILGTWMLLDHRDKYSRLLFWSSDDVTDCLGFLDSLCILVTSRTVSSFWSNSGGEKEKELHQICLYWGHLELRDGVLTKCSCKVAVYMTYLDSSCFSFTVALCCMKSFDFSQGLPPTLHAVFGQVFARNLQIVASKQNMLVLSLLII